MLLGYSPIYHMRDVRKNGHEGHWVRAFEAIFEGKGQRIGRQDFDLFLGDWVVGTHSLDLTS